MLRKYLIPGFIAFLIMGCKGKPACLKIHVLNLSSNNILNKVDVHSDKELCQLESIGPGEANAIKIYEPTTCLNFHFDFSSIPSGSAVKLKRGSKIIWCFNLGPSTSQWYDWCASVVCGNDYVMEFSPILCNY